MRSTLVLVLVASRCRGQAAKQLRLARAREARRRAGASQFEGGRQTPEAPLKPIARQMRCCKHTAMALGGLDREEGNECLEGPMPSSKRSCGCCSRATMRHWPVTPGNLHYRAAFRSRNGGLVG